MFDELQESTVLVDHDTTALNNLYNKYINNIKFLPRDKLLKMEIELLSLQIKHKWSLESYESIMKWSNSSTCSNGKFK